MMTYDALAAHTRDELGITAAMMAQPTQAGLVSAITVASGAPFRWSSRRLFLHLKS